MPPAGRPRKGWPGAALRPPRPHVNIADNTKDLEMKGESNSAVKHRTFRSSSHLFGISSGVETAQLHPNRRCCSSLCYATLCRIKSTEEKHEKAFLTPDKTSIRSLGIRLLQRDAETLLALGSIKHRKELLQKYITQNLDVAWPGLQARNARVGVDLRVFHILALNGDDGVPKLEAEVGKRLAAVIGRAIDG